MAPPYPASDGFVAVEGRNDQYTTVHIVERQLPDDGCKRLLVKAFCLCTTSVCSLVFCLFLCFVGVVGCACDTKLIFSPATPCAVTWQSFCRTRCKSEAVPCPGLRTGVLRGPFTPGVLRGSARMNLVLEL